MNRDTLLEKLTSRREPWDFIIIGGGATGLGSAVEAASRGYATLLLEQDDFAKGTSSRSSKLIHGGVRYLQQGNIPLVFKALHERGLLAKNAPHLVHDLPFLVPNYRWWDAPFYGAGLKFYDLLAGKLSLGPSQFLSRKETLHHAPTLKAAGLRSSIRYHDGQFDDARLAITLAQTLDDLGGIPLNHFRVAGLIKAGNKICGVAAQDKESDATFELQARVVINATGVFTDTVRHMDDPSASRMIAPSQGSHIILPRIFLPGNHAIMVPHTDDGRVFFALPWHNHVLIGTTDEPVPKSSLEPRAPHADIEFLLRHADRHLDPAPKLSDILGVFAGLRPLVKVGDGKDTAALSRDHTLVISPSGLITITGGKWTTYRLMGEDTITHASAHAGLETRPSRTAGLKLHGWTDTPAPEARFAIYGSNATQLRDLGRQDPKLDAPLHPDLPTSGCEVLWAVRHEMARTVEDVLSRRTRSLLLNARASLVMAARVAELMAAELGRDAAWQSTQVAAYCDLATGYFPPDSL